MKIICFGEILLRLSPAAGKRLVQAEQFDVVYGGSEANVAVSMSVLGHESWFVTRNPDNPPGRAALGALSRYGVQTGKAVWGGDRLGIYFLEPGAGLRGSQVIYDRAGAGMATLQPGMINWREVLAGCDWFHWSGITPALSQSAADATREAVITAREMGIQVSCDLNYREKLWKYGKHPAEIMPGLMQQCTVILGDPATFDLYSGVKGVTDDELLREFAAKYPWVEFIAMTKREGLTATHNTYQGILWHKGAIHQSAVYDMPDMTDRIGGGDAFMAGLVHGLSRGSGQLQETIEFAAAAAALKHYIAGDFNLSTEKEIKGLMTGNTGGKVSR